MYGVGHRRVLDSMWLWPRPAPAALIRLLAWELPYAEGMALKKKKKKKAKNKKLYIELLTKVLREIVK